MMTRSGFKVSISSGVAILLTYISTLFFSKLPFKKLISLRLGSYANPAILAVPPKSFSFSQILIW